jgi:GntR family transcriptional repressor for pyruvate dehydrogenase complex
MRMFREIVERIGLLMEDEALKPGDKLLPERELAKRLRTSRISVHDAIRAFEMMGLVETRPGVGTVIREKNTSEIIQPLAMGQIVEKDTLLDMFEIRRIIESSAAAFAAERATEDELLQLESAIDNMIKSFNVKDPKKGEEYDAAFHYIIAEATHNNFLIKLFKTLATDLFRAISVARRQLYIDEHNPVYIIDQHLSIYNAIKGRYPENASLAMFEHLNYVEREMAR